MNIPSESVERLREIGKWLKKNGEAIYGTERALPNWWDFTPGGRITTKGNNAYLCINRWPDDGRLIVTRLANDVREATLLLTGETFPLRREGRRLFIEGLPVHAPDSLMSVLRLGLDGPPRTQYHYKG